MRPIPASLFGSIVLQCVPECILAASLDQWEWRNPLPQGHSLLDVAYGNGVFVAVGDGGTIMSSSDGGVSWTIQDPGSDASRLFEAVIFHNDHFTAVGRAGSSQGLIARSTNGLDWTEQVSPDPGSALTDITYGNGQYVAVGSTRTLISTNGQSWDVHPSSGVTKLAFGDGLFAGVGGFFFTRPIATSTNGIAWGLATNLPGSIRDIAYGNDRFVVIGVDTAITSTDGMTWNSTIYSPSTFRPTAVRFCEGDFLTTGSFVRSSTNGTDWTLLSSVSTAGFNGMGIACGGGDLVSVGVSGDIWSTDTGGVLTRRSTGLSGSPLADIATGNGTYVTVSSALNGGSLGGMFTSSNGMDWTHVAAGQDMGGVVYGGGRFVAVGATFYSSGPMVAYTSTNNAGSFDMVELHVGGKLNDVTYGEGLYVAVGTGGNVFTSTNGTDWIPQASTVTDNLTDVAYGNGRFVVTGGFSAPLLESTNGVMWTAPLSAGAFLARTVAYGNGRFVAVGSKVYTLSDGGSWTEEATVPTNFISSLSFVDGQFVGVGNNFIESSPDGVTWTSHNSGTVATLNGIGFDGTSYVVVGEDSFGGAPVIRQSVSQVAPTVTFANPRLGMSGVFEFDIIAPLSTRVDVRVTSDFQSWNLVDTVLITNSPMGFSDPSATGFSTRFYRGESSQ